MESFHISGSRHGWVNVYSGEQETTSNICFAFPLAQTVKEELYKNVFTTFKKKKRETEIDNGSQKREECQMF